MTATTTAHTDVQRPPMRDGANPDALWDSREERASREALVARYMPLARSLARRYRTSPEPFDDLQQVAALGLLKAIQRFDPERGFPFEAFAVPTILGELRRYFRDSSWAVRVPRKSQERALRVREANKTLLNETGRPPTVRRLAEYLELEVEEVLDALQAIQSYEALSLDAPRPGATDDSDGSLGDVIGKRDHGFELVELNATLQSALRSVPERQRRILHLRFAAGMTQSEIAAEIGVSQMQVSRLLRRSLDQLRDLTGDGLEG
jgi:RNA polymerase sigma-B factor